MAIKKVRIRPEGGNNYADVLHPETSADIVIESENKMFVSNAEKTNWNNKADKDYVDTQLTAKVDKVSGKQLSTEDYTTAEKNKLAGIEEGANKTIINNTLTSTSTTQALSASQGKALKDDLDAHKADTKNPHNVTKSQVGLENVDNVKQMPLSGGEFTGIAKAYPNTSHTVAQMRNIILSPEDANIDLMSEGDIWIKYI